ncbi:MAG: PASTA domain-containing protein [Bacteroidetes bacterium]|nr:PASTA domain-containing protein [bacterium]NBP64829.1 PASTA domain-containing protein [Bacteroidota bacterium]
MMKEFLEQRLGIKQFSKIVAVILLILFLLLWIIDTFLMPPYVHSISIIKVPNITGLTLSSADDIIKRSMLRVAEVREVYSESVPKGRIISQLPFAGSEVRQGRRLYITVSRGIEKVRIPYVIGKSERDAWLEIMRLGFNVGEIEYVEQEDKPDGIVFGQYPQSGNYPYGATISLKVYQAPPETDISTLFEGDIPLSEARNRASQNGMILLVTNPEILQTYSPDSDPVIRPDYSRSGYKLQVGDTIWVEVMPIY